MVLLLTDDTIKDGDFKERIRQLDDKVHKLLFWSALSAVWSYLILIVIISRIYARFNGTRVQLMTCCLLAMYILMGVLIYAVWKDIKYNRSYFYYASKSYLNYQVGKLRGQRKLIVCYLLEYSLLLLIAGVFFYVDVPNGLTGLFRLTAPVSLLTYGCSCYFIANFTKQIRELNMLHGKINALYTAHLNLN